VRVTLDGTVTVVIDSRKLDYIISQIHELSIKGSKLMASIDEIIAATAQQKTVLDSLVTYVNGLEDQIKQIGGLTPAQQKQIDQIFSEITANTAEAAEAMVQNTPSEPV
jgi:chromosome segregation ATPase